MSFFFFFFLFTTVFPGTYNSPGTESALSEKRKWIFFLGVCLWFYV